MIYSVFRRQKVRFPRLPLCRYADPTERRLAADTIRGWPLWAVAVVLLSGVALSGCENGAGGAGQGVATAATVREGTRVGFLGPSFTLERLGGGKSSLAEFRGTVVLLNFWATWCGPCRAEMPSLEALSRQFRSQDFVVVGISSDYEGAQIVEPFMESFGLTFSSLLDPQMQVNEMYQVRSLPTSIVLDRGGVIRHKFFGAMDWNTPKNRDLIQSLVNEPRRERRGQPAAGIGSARGAIGPLAVG